MVQNTYSSSLKPILYIHLSIDCNLSGGLQSWNLENVVLTWMWGKVNCTTVKPRYMAPGYMAEPAYMAGDSWGQNPSLLCKTKIYGGWLNGKPRYMAGQAT